VTQDQQAEFYRSVAGLSAGEAEKKFQDIVRVQETSQVEEHEAFYEFSGEWAPLSVWKAKGYDAELIESKSLPQNRKSHPMFGTVYRVMVEGSGQRGSRKNRTEDRMTAKAKVPRTRASSSGHLMLEDRQHEPVSPSPLSSRSSSSSSSSSSSRKKKSKGKKSKKDKKRAKKSKKDKKEKKPHKRNGSGEDVRL
jgi:hypothetical protein